MQNAFNEMGDLIGSYLPNFLGALIILIIGWAIALIIRTILRKVLHSISLNHRISGLTEENKEDGEIDIESGVSTGVFYLLMLFVLAAVFQTLRITLITDPLNSLLNSLFAFAPKLIGAGILMLVAWVAATLLRMIVSKAMTTAKVDERLGSSAGTEEGARVNITKPISDTVYWLVFLIFLPAVLGALEMKGLLEPVQGMFNKILSTLPNVLTAGVIFAIGWFVARLVCQIAANLLAAAGIDSFSEKLGITQGSDSKQLSGIIGTLLFALIIIPVAIAALNTLQLDAITQPASQMLHMILISLPNIVAAIAVILISYFIGKLVSNLVAGMLSGIGFNSLFLKLGLQKEETAEGKRTASEIAGTLVLATILLFAAVESAGLLGFASLAGIVNEFMIFASHIFMGLVIFAIGLYLANLISARVKESGTSQANLIAGVSKTVILVLMGAIALRQMGLANEIINLAFGLLLGAIAIASAIAFGIGGREIAARKLEEWTHTTET
ncbi:MAG: mechanosensitive ion channel [Nitrospira sp.]|nr:mechanosensitive ion channel [Nitrospira sp.]